MNTRLRNLPGCCAIACAAFLLLALLAPPRVFAAAPEDEIGTTFDRFVAAQNAHDLKAVDALLLDSVRRSGEETRR